MSIYTLIKRIIAKPILKAKRKWMKFNLAANARHDIRHKISSNNISKLSKDEIKEAKAFYKSKGYNLKNTYWHQYYKGMTGKFFKDYLPEDIFRPIIAPKYNKMLQWPALLDKNLSYSLFSDFEQPKAVVSNINGFYFAHDKMLTELEAVNVCLKSKRKLIIKPTLDSGQGKMVKAFSTQKSSQIVEIKDLMALFKSYKKDFIIQEFLEQNTMMKQLNASTLNTLRIMSYLRGDKVYIISTVVRIGKKGTDTDNYTQGGTICGINELGHFNDVGYTKHCGEVFTETESGIKFRECKIPNYEDVKSFVQQLHTLVPYFQIISWDIAISHKDEPVLIEYNTYYQATELHQIVNGPLFTDFFDEILNRGLEL